MGTAPPAKALRATPAFDVASNPRRRTVFTRIATAHFAARNGDRLEAARTAAAPQNGRRVWSVPHRRRAYGALIASRSLRSARSARGGLARGARSPSSSGPARPWFILLTAAATIRDRQGASSRPIRVSTPVETRPLPATVWGVAPQSVGTAPWARRDVVRGYRGFEIPHNVQCTRQSS